MVNSYIFFYNSCFNLPHLTVFTINNTIHYFEHKWMLGKIDNFKGIIIWVIRIWPLIEKVFTGLLKIWLNQGLNMNTMEEIHESWLKWLAKYILEEQPIQLSTYSVGCKCILEKQPIQLSKYSESCKCIIEEQPVQLSKYSEGCKCIIEEQPVQLSKYSESCKCIIEEQPIQPSKYSEGCTCILEEQPIQLSKYSESCKCILEEQHIQLSKYSEGCKCILESFHWLIQLGRLGLIRHLS